MSRVIIDSLAQLDGSYKFLPISAYRFQRNEEMNEADETDELRGMLKEMDQRSPTSSFWGPRGLSYHGAAREV